VGTADRLRGGLNILHRHPRDTVECRDGTVSYRNGTDIFCKDGITD
jgi:hypothetical protein